MKQKWLSTLMEALPLCPLRSRSDQFLVGLWVLGGLAAFVGKIAENLLAGFRKVLGWRLADEQK